ncbi:MAG: cyclic nucleotide-binding domain-containing protein, partial [Thiogranum sp.]
MDQQTMGAAKKLNPKKVLRDLVPINALSEAHIGEVTKKAAIEDVRSGRYVFRKGDRDYQSVYLLDGTVELIGDGRNVVSTVKAGSEDALHPLAHKQPRQLSVRASGKVTVARIDSSLLDVLLTWDESAGYDVVEIDANDDDDWMTRMLQSQAFLQLPPSNIHQLLMRLESVNASAGDAVVRQGEDGDYFYIVKNGRLAVTRK